MKCIRNLSILLLLFFASYAFILADEYCPYPILFVHGINSSGSTWNKTIKPDQAPNLYQYFNHPQEEYYKDPFTNATYLEAFSFLQDGVGSIDPDPPYCGEGTELRRWIKVVLDDYYGDRDTTDISDWVDNPEAKVIIIAHSAGNLATRQYVKEIGTGPLQHHIVKFIGTSAVHSGSDWAYFQWLLGEPLDFVLRFGGYGSSEFVKQYNEMVDLLEALIPLAWTPMAYDLVPASPLIRDLKGQPVPSGMKFHCLVNRHPLPDWPFFTVITIGGVLCTPVPPPFHPLLGGVLIASGTIGEYWNINSDGVVYKTSQNINHIKSAYKAEIEEKRGMGHFAATDQWQVFLKFFEEPPVIHLDSVVTLDGIFPVTDTIDTMPGFITGLQGRVDDYLLASNTLNCRKKINRD
jgi:pimeloyl-ACP methyl ester carboxylesterase